MTRKTFIALLAIGLTMYFGYGTVNWYFRLLGDESDNRFSDSLKTGLIKFSVSESNLQKTISDNKNDSLPFGLLWTDSNPINLLKNTDTIIVNVNADLIKPLDFDGGIEFARDTLFLFVQRLRTTNQDDKVHSTITYIILPDKRTFKEIKFRELN